MEAVQQTSRSDGGPPDTNRNFDHICICALILGLALTAAMATAFRSQCSSFDAMVFIRFAREIERADLLSNPGKPARSLHERLINGSGVLRLVHQNTHHPGHSLLILIVHSVLKPLWNVDEATRWVVSTRVVGIASHGMIVVLAYMIFFRAFGLASAAAAAAMIGLSPPMVRVAADGLSDSPAIALLLLSTLCLCRLVAGGTAHWAVLGGLSAGLGYWIRPEAIQIGLLAAAVLLVSLATGRTPRKATGLSLVCLAGTLALVVAPYMFLKQSPLTKKAQVIDYVLTRNDADAQEKAGNVAANPIPASTRNPATVVPLPDPTTELGTHSYLQGLAIELFRWSALTGHILLPAVILGWGIATCRIRSRPVERLLWMAVAANLLGLPFAVYSLMGYFDVRHAMPMFVLSAGWLWPGSLAICGALRACLSRMSQWVRGREANWPIAAESATFVTLAIALAAVAVAGLQRTPNREIAGYVHAGQWLASHVQDGESVLDPTYTASFYAGLDERNPWCEVGVFEITAMEAAIRNNPRVRWLVASDRLLWELEGGRPIPQQLANTTTREVFSCPIASRSQSRVRIFRLEPDLAQRTQSQQR